MCVCIYIYVYIYIYIYLCIYTYKFKTPPRTHTHVHTYIHTYIHRNEAVESLLTAAKLGDGQVMQAALVCTHVYMCLYVYMPILYICVCVYIYIYIYIYIYMYICVCIYACKIGGWTGHAGSPGMYSCVHAFVCVYAHTLYIYVCVCIYVYVYMHAKLGDGQVMQAALICTHVCTRWFIYTSVICTCMYANLRMQGSCSPDVRVYVYAYVYMLYVYMLESMQAIWRACVCLCICMQSVIIVFTTLQNQSAPSQVTI
jgi:hypothetical protein